MDKPVVEIKSLEDSSSVNKINEFLKSEKITKILEWCFFILGCIQFLMICFVNLTQNQNHLGFDASTFYLRAVESFNQHSLFLDNWVEQTTLMIDSPIPLASLLYGITGNIFISYGLSNIVTVVLFVALAICVLKEINMPRLGGIITLNFILSPYVTPFYNNANPIDYFPSMFIGAAFYYGDLSGSFLLRAANRKQQKGIADWSHAHRFTTSGVYFLFVKRFIYMHHSCCSNICLSFNKDYC